MMTRVPGSQCPLHRRCVHISFAAKGSGTPHNALSCLDAFRDWRRNPFYKNSSKTVEPHLLHEFDSDFYDQPLRLVVTGYLRPEANFPSLDALVAAIRADIDAARTALDTEPHHGAATNPFLLPQQQTSLAT